jgi:WD40 repeat protein
MPAKRRPEKQLTEQMQGLTIESTDLQPPAVELPEGFELVNTKGAGDCFFDAVAKGLSATLNDNYTTEGLRHLCADYMKQQNCDDFNGNWIYEAYLKRLTSKKIPAAMASSKAKELYLKRANQIAWSAKDLSMLGRDALWGEQEIEGRIICIALNHELTKRNSLLRINFHTIEATTASVTHHLIDEQGERAVNDSEVQSLYQHKNIIHILGYNLHWSAIIASNLTAKTSLGSAAKTIMAANIMLKTNSKLSVPKDYPQSAGGLEQPWNFEPSLSYASEWQDKGSYKLLALTPNQLDAKFVQDLYNISHNANYEITDISLISDVGDEQAFVAELDLLQKKHGNWVHNAKWKLKNQNPEQAEPEAIVAARQLIRNQLKTQRYRTKAAPNVKLLPMWHGASVEQIKQLSGAGFSDLSYIENGAIGKGYYGTDNAIAAYEAAYEKYGAKTILMLSWYAGKVVYPTITNDEAKLTGQPHYANHDLHYLAKSDHHEAVVFDPGQILPRYLVSLSPTNQAKSQLMQEVLNTPYCNPGQRPLLFQANFSHVIATLAKQSFTALQTWLKSQPLTNNAYQLTNNPYYQQLMNFLQDSTKDVLLFKTTDNSDSELLAKFLETILLDSHQEGQAIPLHLSLPLITNPKERLVEQALINHQIPEAAITDLKDQQKFTFIISGYTQKIPLLKANHLNRPGGFRGKVIAVVPATILADGDNYVFYPEGGTTEQQANRLISQQLTKFNEQQINEQLSFITAKTTAANSKLRLPSEQYFAATQQATTLPPAPGGALKPWEYCNELSYSNDWQDKGAFKLHSLTPNNPDYDFVAKLYQQTPMPGYELDEVYVISDHGAEQAFTAQLNTLERLSVKPEHQPTWQTEDHITLREQTIDLLNQKSYKTLLAHSVKLLPLWHGTGPGAASGIAKSGFASLALVDAGFFGKGLYGSGSAEYSYRVYAKGMNGDDGLLILSWYSAQNVYPVVKWDTHPGVPEEQDKLLGKPNYKNYDSHFIPVKPRDPKKHQEGTEDAYYPIGDNEASTYQEFVTFPTAQVLPRYILSLRDTTTKQRLSGMEKFLKTATSTATLLYQHSLDWAVAALKESARTEREEDFMLNQGLSLYIPCFATNSDKIENVDPKDQYPLYDKAQQFMQSPKELWLLQGNAGSGKSLFGRYLEQQLWDNYQPGNLIPLFIPLPRITNPGTDLIQKALELKGIPTANILELKKHHKFLFILDGYDEIPGKPKLLQQYKFNELNSWQGKIIVGCRMQHLSSSEEQLLYPKHPGDSLTQSIERSMKSYIIPFKQEQIDCYIEGFCNSKFNQNDDGTKKWQITQYQEKIAEFKEISEFLKEPFLLFLVLSVLPHLSEKFASAKPKVEIKAPDVNAESLVEFVSSAGTIKKIDLYDAFTESWFKSQFERMTQHYAQDLSDYSQEKLLDIFRNYAKKLAFKMFLEETQITTHPLDPEFGKFFIGSDEKSKELAELGFQGSPLKRIGESYLFMHKSFQEYFVAKKILNELETSPESTPSLQQKIITDPAILAFISNHLPLFGEQSLKLQKILFNIIEKSRFTEIPQYSRAAANAATILNFARIPFSNHNLQGISIPHADLTGAILDHTNLENANLSYVKLKSAWLALANLKNANLTGAIFGELAYKDLDGYVTECKYSPDGKYFAATTNSKTTIYKVEKTGSLTEVTSPDESSYNFQANSAASPNGQYSATIDGENIELYKIDESGNKTLVNTLTGHTDLVFSATLSPDNQWLASGSSDKTVRLWSLSDPTKTHTLTGHTNSVFSVTFSPDNQWLASGSSDNTVRLWSLSDPTKTHTLTGHTSYVLSVTFSPDNQWLASGSYDKTVRLWSLSDPTKTHTLTGHTSYVLSVTFSPDNQWLASGSGDTTVRLWSLSDPTKTHTLTGHTNYVNSVTFSPDNQWLASGSYDNTVRLWSLSDPTKTHTLTGHTNDVNSVTFSPDNQWLASGSDDNTVRLWSLSDPTKTHTLTGHTNSVFSVTFSPDNQWLASGSRDNTVRLWSLSDPTKTHTLTGHTDLVRSVTFSPDNQWLASGSNDKTILIWNMQNMNLSLSELPVAFRLLTNFEINSLTYHQIGAHLYLATGGFDCSVRLFEQLPNGELMLLWTSSQTILASHQSDLTLAAMSSTNSELLLQRGATGDPKITELPDEPPSPAIPNKSKLLLLEPISEQSLEAEFTTKCSITEKPVTVSALEPHSPNFETLHAPLLFSKPSSTATPVFKSTPEQLELLLHHVAYGKQHEAEIMLLQNPALALLYGNVTDCAGRQFQQISALQYAIWALDYRMQTMLLQYMPPNEIAQQISNLNSAPWTQEHGAQISWQNLITALQQYSTNYNKLNIEQRSMFWATQVGGAQLLLPAHVINEYSHPGRPFYPCSQYEENNALSRTGIDSWKKLAAYTLGENFAWIRANNHDGKRGICGVASLEQTAMDAHALTELLRARRFQTEQLTSSFSSKQHYRPQLTA